MGMKTTACRTETARRDMSTGDLSEDDSEERERWSVRCVVDRHFYTQMHNDLCNVRAIVYNRMQDSVIQLAYVRLFWKRVSTMFLIAAKRGLLVQDIDFHSNVIECILKAWFDMCHKENVRLIKRFADIERDKRELESRFVVVDTPFGANSTTESVGMWLRSLAAVLG